MINILKKLFSTFIIALYPNKCMFCEEVLYSDKLNLICKHCDMEINYILNTNLSNVSVFTYDDFSRRAILRFKYNGKKHYAKSLAMLLYDMILTLNISSDLIINVPMYIKKKHKRGYDQAEVLAFHLSCLSGIPFESLNLIRTKNTIPQSRLTIEDRKTNVKNIFSIINNAPIKDKRIILVDDIYTTGNTIKECGKCLLENGASEIIYVTLSKSLHKNHNK